MLRAFFATVHRPTGLLLMAAAAALSMLRSAMAGETGGGMLPPLAPPSQSVRDCIGINIHFTSASPSELKLLADTGVGRVRMDIAWKKIERHRGVYDFSTFDALMTQLDGIHIRPILILDYGNSLYTGGDNLPPVTPAARDAFAAWAAATVAHFAGRGIIWEMYNEPNNKEFWSKDPNAAAFAALALQAGRQIHATSPTEVIMGPALAGVDLKFLQNCLNDGILSQFSGISVHPYRHDAPETFGSDLNVIRRMIQADSPRPEVVPVVAGEWGYPTAWVTPKVQAEYLAREMLFDLAAQVPITIWYDWRHGGSEIDKPDIFGLIDLRRQSDGTERLEPNRAYRSLRSLMGFLGGTRFVRCVPTRSAHDWLLEFAGPKGPAYAAWRTESTAKGPMMLPSGTLHWFDLNGLPLETPLVTTSPIYGVSVND